MNGGIVSRLRWKWFLATRGMGFQADYLDRVYQIYLNHNKVIHYRDGRPVRSLTTPAVLSKPMANFMARNMYATIQNRRLPSMLSFAVTDLCNASCEHCSFFEGVEEKGRSVLTTAQAQKLIRDAQELGVSVVNILGGEPLMREDLPEIIQSVDKDLSTTLLVTNGAMLADKALLLRRSGLDSVYVSIDSANPVKHDLFRGSKGLFAKAMEGIQKAKAAGLSVGLACTLTPESFEAGELERLIELGKSVGVHELQVFDAMPSGRYQMREDLVDNFEWVDRMIEATKPYNADPSYPGIQVLANTFSHRSTGCACGTSYFYVSPYGDVMSCDFNHAKFGNVLQVPLYQIWDHLSSQDEFCRSKWGGCKVKDSTYLGKGTVVNGKQEDGITVRR